MKNILLIVFLLFEGELFGQICYTGYVDKNPIEVAINIYGDGVVNGVYAYTKFDTPVPLHGSFKNNTLVLDEKDGSGKATATVTFSGFDPKAKSVTGKWSEIEKGTVLDINLKKKFEIDFAKKGPDVELLQTASLKDRYFRMVISCVSGYPRAFAVKIIQKRTDEVQQAIEFDGQFSGPDDVAVDDYNFDGYEDFSVLETSYAGANTSRIYFLYNPRLKYYYKSDLTGVSLVFDQESKTIAESNECCGGTVRTTKLYKLTDNKMILIEEHCFKWDKEKKELVERKMSECN